MKIVPAEEGLEVEVLLQNKDIGFVHDSQQAAIKVEAFSFTKYGLLDAKVIDISDDAINDQALGWVYKARLALEQEYLSVDGKKVRLSSEMSVSADVKTGKRRLMEFFLSPLLRYQQESVRER